MKNSKEESLMIVNENGIFYKIKRFFKNLFNQRNISNDVLKNEKIDNVKSENNMKPFMEHISNIKSEETELLGLQRRYRTGELTEEELTKEQVNALCDLYDKQIARLRKSNEIRKQKLLEHREKLQFNN